MALSVTEKQELIKLMRERVATRVKAIESEHEHDIRAIEGRARKEAIRTMGITKALDDLDVFARQIAALQSKLDALELRTHKKIDPDNTSSYNVRNQIDRLVDEAARTRRDDIVARTTWGRDIKRLEEEQLGIKTALLLATSGRQVKELWQRFTNIIGDESQTDLEIAGLEIKDNR